MFHIVTPEKGKPFTIGRKEDCDIRFSDVFVSREHATIEFSNETWILKNLSSNSVTQVNDKDVSEVELNDGDIIVIGLHRLRVTLRGDALSLLLLDSSDSTESFTLSSEGTEVPLETENGTTVFTAKLTDDGCSLLFKKKISDSSGKKIQEIRLNASETARFENYEFTLQSGDLLVRRVMSGFDVMLRHLDVYTGKKELLSDINLYLPAGEILAIIGRSGQGKSSLLKMLKGEYTKSPEGEILFSGLDYRNKEIRKCIAFLPQDPALHKDLTVMETLYHGAKVSMDKKELKASFEEKALRICELFGLTARKDNPVKTLSGGEMRRLALAQELIGAPGLIVLDEPLSGLDPYNANILCTHLKQLAFLGHTVILTTHSYEALNIANKVLVIHQGKQVFYGTREESVGFFNTKSAESILAGLKDDSFVRWASSKKSLEVSESQKKSSTYFADEKKSALLPYHIGLILKHWSRDKGKMAALLIQPFILGFVFSQIFSNNSSLWIVSFAIILCANWFALSLSIREIVQEKEILTSDLRKGMPIFPYLLAKTGIPSIAAFLQTLIIYGFISFKVTMHPSALFLCLVFALTVIPAVSMGCLVSAFSKNPGQANAFLPLIIIPQVALAGALVPLDQMQAVGKALSYLIWSRYDQSTLLDVLLERPFDRLNLIMAMTLSLIFCIITFVNLYHLRKAR